MMFWGIPSRHRQSIIHSQWYHFLSFVHCALIVALCTPIAKRFFLPVLSIVLPFRRESVASRVRNVRCSEFFHHAIRTCSTDNIFRNRGRLPCGVPSVSSLTVHIVSRCTPKINHKFEILWREILFALYTIPP